MAINSSSYTKIRKPNNNNSSMPTLTHLLYLLFISFLLFILLLHFPPSSSYTSSPTTSIIKHFSGDLRNITFSWNSLKLTGDKSPPTQLKIAVFSRKWPVVTAPGGMERHAMTLHYALARRNHDVHVFTSAPSPGDLPAEGQTKPASLHVHHIHALPGQWKSDLAWELFDTENARGVFDVVHSESVALFHRQARHVPNLAVSWHGISLEALHSGIYQDLTRSPDEPISPAFNQSLAHSIYKVLDEIRFFHSYKHHVAISDSSGEILRDVYQIPPDRVHVILNGVDEENFEPDKALGKSFREEIGIPSKALVVFGVAGRLVKDKGYPLLYEAFSKFMSRHPDVYLVVAGSGPWAKRFEDLGLNVKVLGALPPAKLKAFYNSLDLFVNPTLRPQGLDLTLMEAMECGTAVAATRFPSIKGSIVVDDEFGYMFSPNVDSLRGVLDTAVAEGAGRLAERGRACRSYAKRMFGARKMALAYERLFLCIKDDMYCKYPIIDFDM
ncbi:Phosphatidylinositol N-acetylglucosaminyltransferase protein [Dioscorea alata]|uniref:Phosphatidylinositol N-acetylglucosaminyltransferase protein n=1 Tax=Dioscorea alata TaxID=55571 RepID=A0ACB7WDH1_DIOAL|nr:Phosphatidylinositol N-acetylglucosaminyltransferase protein [Dioscorea alata]